MIKCLSSENLGNNVEIYRRMENAEKFLLARHGFQAVELGLVILTAKTPEGILVYAHKSEQNRASIAVVFETTYPPIKIYEITEDLDNSVKTSLEDLLEDLNLPCKLKDVTKGH